MRNSGKSGERKNWWKLHEACIQMFGMMKDRILEKQKAGTLSFNVATFLENVVLVNLGDSGESSSLIVPLRAAATK